VVRKRNGKSEKTEKQKFKTADKISYFGQRRHVSLSKKLSVNKKARFVTNLVFFIAKLRIICAFIHIFCIGDKQVNVRLCREQENLYKKSQFKIT